MYYFLQTTLEFLKFYFYENTICLIYGFDWMINKFSMSMGCINLVADLSEIFGVVLVSLLLLVTIVSTVAFIHSKVSNSLQSHLVDNNNLPETYSYFFIFKNLFKL